MSISYEVPNPDGMDSYHETYPQPPPNAVPDNQVGISQAFNNRIIELTRGLNRDMRRMPRVGRKELDLYKLYCAVQRRGGYKNI